MNWRKPAYFALLQLTRGQQLGRYYEHFRQQEKRGIPTGITHHLLIELLDHCKKYVPYYAQIMQQKGDGYKEDPEEYLRTFPILTKDMIRKNANQLRSADLAKRKWYFNTSGGSTGEPGRFIQDWDYAAKAGALKLLFSNVAADKEIGESEIVLWGSERDITGSRKGLSAEFISALTNSTILSVLRVEPEIVRKYIRILNEKRPKLIIGYPSATYQIAKAAESNQLEVVSQHAIITTAGTLYPHMRETIEKVFQCKVFDRYGSREVGDIACECPGYDGLWIPPWGNYLEIIDKDNNRVPDGSKGEILVTSLSNYAMPLIRYQIGDRGALSPSRQNNSQLLADILGRSYDVFINRKGAVIEGGYFMPRLYFKDWIAQYQVIQKGPASVLFKIVRSSAAYPQAELEELSAKAKLVMGDDACEIRFEFVDDIPASPSGKFRFIISEVPHSG